MTFSKAIPTESIYVTDTLEEIRQHGHSDFPFAIYQVAFSPSVNNHIRWHWHNEIELIYVLQGKGKFKVSDIHYELSEGQGLFINANTLHSTAPLPGESCIYYSIVFHPAVIFGYDTTYLSRQYLQPIIEATNLPYLLWDGTEPFHQPFLDIMQMLLQLNEEKDFGHELNSKIQLLKLWMLLLHHLKNWHPHSHTRNPKQSLDELRAKDALSFIEKHYAEPLTLDDIAASIHISNSECCRCFKRCIKLTPFEYLMRYRIYVATSRLLRNDYSSMAELASEVGFNNSSYFNKLFRKYLGCTPTEFKKNPSEHDFSESHFLTPFK